ncbi:hypothetical protein ACFLS1_10445, partial [Verrucomicrobiota bacterium]
FCLGLKACGGWESFSTVNADKLHMILPANHPELPWTGVLSGMGIVILYYCGLNQFIVQRNLAAKTLRDGQLGVIFAGALWVLVPFAIVMPGIMSFQLYGDQMARADEAFPTLIKNLIPMGMKGFMFAAIAGAVISSLASMLNSASTIFTMDVFHRMINRKAPQKQLVLLGRIMTIVFVIVGCLMAPALDDPRFKGVFNFIQQFQGYIWPGVVAAFLFGFLVKRAPAPAGAVALVGGPVLYGLLQFFSRQGLFSKIPGDPLITMHFLIQVAIAFVVLCIVMGAMTLIAPLKEPKVLPVRKEMDLKTAPEVKLAGVLVIIAVAIFYAIFW